MRSSGLDVKVKNWYSDKYVIANVQKNILFILTIFLSVGIFVSVLLVKYVYENKSVEPYLIEIDKKSGTATVVESQSIRQFTGSEVIKEAFVVKYIKAREGYRKETYDDDVNFVRLGSDKSIFAFFTENSKLSAAADLKENEKEGRVDVAVKSILFISGKMAEVKITRLVKINGAVVRKRFFKIRLIFEFFDLEFPLEERYLNPLGFQVVSYTSNEEKVSEDYDPDKEDLGKNNTNADVKNTKT